MRIVFMGTPEFAVPSLRRLVDAGYKPVAVVTAPDRRKGRGRKLAASPVKQAADAYDIPVLQPEDFRDPGFLNDLAALQPEVMVVVAFRILPPEVYRLASKGAFNLHASLLPAFRGAAPINRAVMAGAEQTGVTTFFLREKVDTGDMILQRSTPIGEAETAGELHDRLMEMGADAVVETVRLIETGEARAMPQRHELATPAPKISSEHCWIAWSRDALDVHNQIRGLSPSPGAWTTHQGKLLKIFKSAISPLSGRPGEVLRTDNDLMVACGRGAVELLDVQLEGKRRQSVESFLRGYEFQPGEILGESTT